MHQHLWRDGISRLSSVYDQIAIADNSTLVLINDFSEVQLWLLWEGNNGYESWWVNGYNALVEGTDMYGSWTNSDTDGQLCLFKVGAHGLSFRNRMGASGNFSFHCFGGRADYS